MHAVSTNQNADILHFNDNGNYLIKRQSERYILKEKTYVKACCQIKVIKFFWKRDGMNKI